MADSITQTQERLAGWEMDKETQRTLEELRIRIKELEVADSRADVLVAENASLKQRLDDTLSEHVELEEDHKALLQQQGEMQDRINTFQAIANGAEKERAAAVERMDKLSSSLLHQCGIVENVRRELAQQAQWVREAWREADANRERAHLAERKMAEAQAQVAQLKGIIANYEGMSATYESRQLAYTQALENLARAEKRIGSIYENVAAAIKAACICKPAADGTITECYHSRLAQFVRSLSTGSAAATDGQQ